jgi:hypothetical protein
LPLLLEDIAIVKAGTLISNASGSTLEKSDTRAAAAQYRREQSLG